MAVWLALVVIVNRTCGPAPLVDLGLQQEAPVVGDVLTVATWNVGYAGLGAADDFVGDGGGQVRPPRATLHGNLRGIVDTTQAELSDVDVVLLQEVATPSFVTHRVDVEHTLRSALRAPRYDLAVDLAVRGLPAAIGGTRVGNATASRVDVEEAHTHPLPLEPFRAVVYRHHHRALVTLLRSAPRQPGWVVMNVHLSAFDRGAKVRVAQLQEVLALCARLAQAGHAVVLGGDFNLELADPGLVHKTPDETIAWVHPFPVDLLPHGFRIAAPDRVPTVRSVDAPYTPGVTWAGVIDGFVVSPGVEIVRVEALDLDFRHADHQPVVATFRRSDNLSPSGE